MDELLSYASHPSNQEVKRLPSPIFFERYACQRCGRLLVDQAKTNIG
jgi:hypothetical protein